MEVWNEITYPFQNINDAPLEVRYGSNFISHLMVGVITYLYRDLSQTMLVKMGSLDNS